MGCQEFRLLLRSKPALRGREERSPTEVIVVFVDAHGLRFGVEVVFRVVRGPQPAGPVEGERHWHEQRAPAQGTSLYRFPDLTSNTASPHPIATHRSMVTHVVVGDLGVVRRVSGR